MRCCDICGHDETTHRWHKGRQLDVCYGDDDTCLCEIFVSDEPMPLSSFADSAAPSRD